MYHVKQGGRACVVLPGEERGYVVERGGKWWRGEGWKGEGGVRRGGGKEVKHRGRGVSPLFRSVEEARKIPDTILVDESSGSRGGRRSGGRCGLLGGNSARVFSRSSSLKQLWRSSPDC